MCRYDIIKIHVEQNMCRDIDWIELAQNMISGEIIKDEEFSWQFEQLSISQMDFPPQVSMNPYQSFTAILSTGT